MSRVRVLVSLLGAVGALLSMAAPAAAQDEPAGTVDISFEIGPYDTELDDFPLSAVVVTGDLEEGKDVTIDVKGSGGRVLWSGTAPFRAPSTTIPVDDLVSVGDIASAGVGQARDPVVAGVVIEPPEVFHAAGGATGSGQLALSMVVIIALFAILFRAPLPSATTQRWVR